MRQFMVLLRKLCDFFTVERWYIHVCGNGVNNERKRTKKINFFLNSGGTGLHITARRFCASFEQRLVED